MHAGGRPARSDPIPFRQPESQASKSLVIYMLIVRSHADGVEVLESNIRNYSTPQNGSSLELL